jgi:hypothetical protein
VKANRQKHNWIIDALLFAGFLVCFYLDLTGVLLHQWLGVAAGALAAYHLARHWDWVVAVAQRFFGRTPAKNRLNFVVDASIFSGLALIIVTGLVISTWASLSLTHYAAWRSLHLAASVGTLAALVFKIALHWRWVVSVANKHVFARSRAAEAQQSARATATATTLDRRAFLRVMGVVGAAALLSAASGLQRGKGLLGEQAVEAEGQDRPPAGGSRFAPARSTLRNAVATPAPGAQSCSYRCPYGRHCSYPGRCFRYRDGNGNRRCDLGECL